MKAKEEAQRIIQRLRLAVYMSDLTQREIERRLDFSRGYLSQLLGGSVEMKLWQLLAVLHVIGLDPGDFFADVFPRRGHETADLAPDTPRGARKPLSLELARLYGFGIESIDDFRERLERCEDALSHLRRLGILKDS